MLTFCCEFCKILKNFSGEMTLAIAQVILALSQIFIKHALFSSLSGTISIMISFYINGFLLATISNNSCLTHGHINLHTKTPPYNKDKSWNLSNSCEL